ncbi:peptidase inhibitor 16 [Pelodiscus sinensis]|uniref:peptidase inhibitor 16 n=1 Tax=Pelodiscus sinensis TaxID=13735 RepID=UPI003F6A69E1
MLSSGLLPLLLLLTAVELSWALTEDDKRLIVEMHNNYRSQVSPPAADMLKMSWDPELEAFAKAYAAKCIWGHNKARGRRGENLFAITDEMDVEVAMEQWYDEQEHYNLTTAKCALGQMCGHYTQVVWASSKYIGCGTQFCKTLHGVEDPDLYLLVCNYSPPGNVRGRKPYKEGPACSQCPEGYTCRNLICEPRGDSEETSTSSRTRPAPTTTTSPPTTAATRPAPTTTTSPPTTTATRPAPSTTTSPPTTAATRPAPSTTTSPPTTAATRPAPTTTTSPPTTTATRPAPTTTTSPPTTTATRPAPTTTTSPPTTTATRPAPTTTTSPPTTTATRPAPTTTTSPPTTTATRPAPTTTTSPPTTAATRPAPTTTTSPPTTAATRPAPSTTTSPPTTAATRPAPSTTTSPPTTAATRPAPTTTTSPPTTAATRPAPSTTTSPPTTAATRPAPSTTTSPPTTDATRPAPTTVEKKPGPPTRPALTPSTLNPTISPTATRPALVNTTMNKRPTPTPSSLTPTLRARPNPPSATGPTPSLEPTSDLDLTPSPEKQVGSEETGAPLATTEDMLFLDLESTFGPPASPGGEGAWKEPNAVSLGAEPALSSEPPPSFSLMPLETELSLANTKQPPPALQPAPATAKVTVPLHVLPSSKATGGHNLAAHSSLSGAREIEELMTGPTQKDLDQLSGSATSNFLEFSLFLLTAPLLTGLLL